MAKERGTDRTSRDRRPPKLVFLIDNKPIEGLQFDEETLVDKADAMQLEGLHPEYGHGLSLPSKVIENVAFKNMD